MLNSKWLPNLAWLQDKFTRHQERLLPSLCPDVFPEPNKSDRPMGSCHSPAVCQQYSGHGPAVCFLFLYWARVCVPAVKADASGTHGTPPSVPVCLEQGTTQQHCYQHPGTITSSQENAWRAVSISPVGQTLLFNRHRLWL